MVPVPLPTAVFGGGGAAFGMAHEVEHEELSSPTREIEYAVRVRIAIAPTNA